MSNAQNKDVLESTTSYATIWSDTDWKKTYKYVNKQRHRIFRAESGGDRREEEVYQQQINSDKGLFEPYVLVRQDRVSLPFLMSVKSLYGDFNPCCVGFPPLKFLIW